MRRKYKYDKGQRKRRTLNQIKNAEHKWRNLDNSDYFQTIFMILVENPLIVKKYHEY